MADRDPDVARFDIPRLKRVLQSEPFGHTVVYRRQVDSTMDLARTLAADPNIYSGTLICTEVQTSGRGRRRQTWHAPSGTSLLVSFILKSDMLLHGVERLSMCTAIATVSALRTFLPQQASQFWLKWPNDVLAVQSHTTPVKIAGLLAETAFHGNQPSYAILGIGINVNQRVINLPQSPPNAQTPGSLYLITGTLHDRTDLLIELSRALGQVLQIMSAPEIFVRWRDMLHTLDKPVVVHPLKQETGPNSAIIAPWMAHAVDVRPNGDLVLRDTHNQIHIVQATEVSVRTDWDANEYF